MAIKVKIRSKLQVKLEVCCNLYGGCSTLYTDWSVSNGPSMTSTEFQSNVFYNTNRITIHLALLRGKRPHWRPVAGDQRPNSPLEQPAVYASRVPCRVAGRRQVRCVKASKSLPERGAAGGSGRGRWRTTGSWRLAAAGAAASCLWPVAAGGWRGGAARARPVLGVRRTWEHEQAYCLVCGLQIATCLTLTLTSRLRLRDILRRIDPGLESNI
jgi:hypothetical protein